MRLNLLLDNHAGVRSGYLNIDPFAPEGDATRLRADAYDLSHSVDASEAEEIVAHGLLDYVSFRQVDVVLTGWLSRLARGGKLVVSTVDVMAVARGLTTGKLNPDQANQLLYGEQESSWDFRRCGFTLSRLTDEFTRLGYVILQAKVENYRAILTIERP